MGVARLPERPGRDRSSHRLAPGRKIFCCPENVKSVQKNFLGSPAFPQADEHTWARLTTTRGGRWSGNAAGHRGFRGWTCWSRLSALGGIRTPSLLIRRAEASNSESDASCSADQGVQRASPNELA